MLFALLMLLSATNSAFADEGPTNINDKGYAIEGYDVVAYFKQSKPVQGDVQHSFQWNHGIWLFSSKENLVLFKENPEKYAPQFGGYCAYAVAKDNFAPIEPEQWSIVDGRLYLNYNARISKRWKKKRDFYIDKANGNWGELLVEALENIK